METSQIKTLKEKAESILKSNIYRLGTDSGYIAASGPMLLEGEDHPRFLYPFQWLWDTFFISGWTTDIEQGITDIQKFLHSQREDGFLGHIRYNREVLARKEYFPGPEIYYPDGLPETGEIISKITQPPNVAYGVWELSQKISDPQKKKDFLETVYPKVLKYHQYLYSRLVKDGLMVTIHPWAAGTDNSPIWDTSYARIFKKFPAHDEAIAWLEKVGLKQKRLDTQLINSSQRPISSDYDIYLFLLKLYSDYDWNEKTILKESPFRICDPLTNSVLLRSNHCLKEIALTLKQDHEEIDHWLKITSQALENLYDEKDSLYYSLDIVTEKPVKIPTVSSLMPLFSLSITPERSASLAANIYSIHEQYPDSSLIPSTFPSDSSFEPNRYWRGPTWILTNTLISDGLRHYGHQNLAKAIDDNSLNLIDGTLGDRGGFFEYFNPLTKEGLGSPGQSWTAASVLKICENIL